MVDATSLGYGTAGTTLCYLVALAVSLGQTKVLRGSVEDDYLSVEFVLCSVQS